MTGRTIAHFHVLEKLGGGGMGVVYLAEDTRLHRNVALKFLPAHLIADERARERFIREARAASALNHENICTIHDIGQTDNGQTFIAMAHYEGMTLKQKLASGAIPIAEAIKITQQVAEGLAAAHDKGIIHRDVKPANIFITNRGRAIILDFGIAKLSDALELTRTGSTVGTMLYMSPEQMRGDELDGRTDIWSLGVVLYEMLSGRRPFDAEYLPAVIYSVLNEDAPDLTAARPDIPESLQRIVNRCLEKEPTLRYPNVGALLSDLNELERSEGASRTSHRKAPTAIVAVSSIAIVAVVLVSLLALLRLGPFRSDQDHQFENVRIAFLPLLAVGENPVSEHVAEGLHHSLTSELVRLQRADPRLSVIPTSEVLTENVRNAREADSAFGVNRVISATIGRVGRAVRLTLTLVDVSLRDVISEETIDASPSNLLAFQDEALVALSSLLRVDLDGYEELESMSGGTHIPDAYELYLQGEGYLRRYAAEENVDSAIALLERAVDADERYALAHAALGEAYWRKYELTNVLSWVDKAVESAHVALGLDNGLPQVHATLGLIYFNRGRTQDAIEAYRAALLLEPSNVASLIGLGRCYEDQGRLPEAEATFRRAIELRPDHLLGFNRLGILYYNTQRFPEAAEQFERMIEVAPDNPWGYNNLSSTYDELGRSTDAIRLLQQAIDIEPAPMFYRNLTALYYFDEGKYARAARTAEEALALGELEYRTWSQLANAYYWAPGERARALDAWNRSAELARDALRVNPRDTDALDHLASALANLGRREEALEAVRSLQSQETLRPANWNTIAHVYERLGERDSALVYVREAIAAGLRPKYVLKSPWLADLRRDPEFSEIERLLGSR